MLRPSLCSEVDGLNDAQTSELGRLSTGKGGLPLWGWRQNRNHTPPQPWTTDKKKPPPKAGVPKTLLGSVTLFPPREAFFPHKNNMATDQQKSKVLGFGLRIDPHRPWAPVLLAGRQLPSTTHSAIASILHIFPHEHLSQP